MTPGFTWYSYGSMWLPLVKQGVSRRALQWYSICYCVSSYENVYTWSYTNDPLLNTLNEDSLYASKCKRFRNATQ
jgi:hypothetical protein